MSERASITIHTDGACLGNPGPGGYGVVVLHGTKRVELSAGFRHTTNNRMEILAAIVALESLEPGARAVLHSDSRLLVDGIEKGWAERWRKNGWMRNKNERAINPDLWGRLLAACETRKVTFHWVRGHAGNRENERCDVLANEAASGRVLAEDAGYAVERAGGPPRPSLFS